jgi:hypothetical protein
MRRIVVCLLIALASTGAAARETRLSDAEGGSCRGAQTSIVRPAERDTPALPAPAKKTKSMPSTNGGGGDDVRLPSPRWHRFLPGMFR